MIYKSVIDFPSESKSIDESCFDFIRDVSIDSLHPLEYIAPSESRPAVENGYGLAIDSRAPYAQNVIGYI